MTRRTEELKEEKRKGKGTEEERKISHYRLARLMFGVGTPHGALIM